MQANTKFLFDRDFDDLDILREIVEQEQDELDQAEADEAEIPPEPAAPTFSEEDLARARQQGYERGKKEGIAETLAGIEQRVEASLAVVATRVEELVAAQAEAKAATERDAVHLSLAIARKLFGRWTEMHGREEIVAVAQEVLSNLVGEPRILITTSAADADAIRERLADYLERRGFRGELDVRGESGLAPGDCRIEWTGGNAERDGAALLEEIEAAILRHVGGAPATPAGPTEI